MNTILTVKIILTAKLFWWLKIITLPWNDKIQDRKLFIWIVCWIFVVLCARSIIMYKKLNQYGMHTIFLCAYQKRSLWYSVTYTFVELELFLVILWDLLGYSDIWTTTLQFFSGSHWIRYPLATYTGWNKTFEFVHSVIPHGLWRRYTKGYTLW